MTKPFGGQDPAEKGAQCKEHVFLPHVTTAGDSLSHYCFSHFFVMLCVTLINFHLFSEPPVVTLLHHSVCILVCERFLCTHTCYVVFLSYSVVSPTKSVVSIGKSSYKIAFGSMSWSKRSRDDPAQLTPNDFAFVSSE